MASLAQGWEGILPEALTLTQVQHELTQWARELQTGMLDEQQNAREMTEQWLSDHDYCDTLMPCMAALLVPLFALHLAEDGYERTWEPSWLCLARGHEQQQQLITQYQALSTMPDWVVGTQRWVLRCVLGLENRPEVFNCVGSRLR